MAGKAPRFALLSAGILIAAWAASGECMGKVVEPVVLKGTVRVIGNEPFSRLVLTVPDPAGGGRPSDYVVKGPLAAEIKLLHQGKVLTLEGTPCADDPPGPLPCIEPNKVLKID